MFEDVMGGESIDGSIHLTEPYPLTFRETTTSTMLLPRVAGLQRPGIISSPWCRWLLGRHVLSIPRSRISQRVGSDGIGNGVLYTEVGKRRWGYMMRFRFEYTMSLQKVCTITQTTTIIIATFQRREKSAN